MHQQLLILEPQASVLEAIQRLSQSQLGCILVLEQQRLVGICTEQDCLQSIAAGSDPETTSIAALMTRSPITLSDSETLGTAWQRMQHHHIQHLPIVNQAGRVLGIVTESSLLQAADPALWLESSAQPVEAGASASRRGASDRDVLDRNVLARDVLDGETMERPHFYDQLHLQAQREQALSRVIQVIRNSLELDTVFATATTEIAQLLQADRADIIQYLPANLIWKVVSDSHDHQRLTDIVGMEFADDANQPIAQLKRLEVVQLENVAQHPDATVSQYAQSLPGTWLLVPLHFETRLWGCLALVRNHQQPWQEAEVGLARAVSDQLSIAIQQSQLYQQVRQLNETLENQVQERTTQLRKALDYEALLKRITDRVRDSLDEHYILQSTVQELAAELDVLCCDTGLYDTEYNTMTICYEAIRSEDFAAAKGSVMSLDTLSEIGEQTLLGRWVQFCSLSNPLDAVREVSYRFAILSCPLLDNQGVLGNIWLFRPCNQWFNESEIRLVQQVANQCAIALRQSRLYQEIQAQVNNLEQLNYLKDDFLSSVSHELRTPMANIKMATQMLEILFKQIGGGNQESRISQYFKVLQDECQREINLINDLLELSRVESGDNPLTLSTRNLQSWIPGMIGAFGDRAQTQQQTLCVEVPARLLPLTTDFFCLERILTELLQNAFKYTPPGETIAIAAVATANDLQIRVSNTGIELAASELNRIFDKFYRIPNSDPWKHGGTGLGLALVKRLTEHLGARIHAESANQQTTFMITFAIEPTA